MLFHPDSEFVGLVQTFAPLFSTRVWPFAQALLLGAILAPGKRTVSSILRLLGLGGLAQFQNYHRVRNRAQGATLWGNGAYIRPNFRGLLNRYLCLL
jgi:hypothetical protein